MAENFEKNTCSQGEVDRVFYDGQDHHITQWAMAYPMHAMMTIGRAAQNPLMIGSSVQ